MTERLFIFRHQLVRVSGMHQTGLDAMDARAYLYDLAPLKGATISGVRYSEFEAAPDNVSILPQRTIPPMNAADMPGTACFPQAVPGDLSTMER
jgi:hypothetical protein